MPDALLDSFNAAPAERAREVLAACNAAPRFAADVVAGRPYPSAAALVARAAAFGAARPFGSAPKRSLADLGFVADFNGLDMAL